MAFFPAVQRNTSIAGDTDALPDATVSECLSMLNEVKNSRRKHLGEDNIATGEAFYVLGLMLAFVDEFTPAIEHLNTAKEIFASQYVSRHQEY